MWRCPNCGVEAEDDLDICWKCGTGKDGTPSANPDAYADTREEIAELEIDPGDGSLPAERRLVGYGIIADGLFVVAGIVAIVTIVMAFVGTVGSLGSAGGPLVGLMVLAYGAFLVLLVAALGAIVRLLVDIEFNTRRRE